MLQFRKVPVSYTHLFFMIIPHKRYTNKTISAHWTVWSVSSDILLTYYFHDDIIFTFSFLFYVTKILFSPHNANYVLKITSKNESDVSFLHNANYVVFFCYIKSSNVRCNASIF